MSAGYRKNRFIILRLQLRRAEQRLTTHLRPVPQVEVFVHNYNRLRLEAGPTPIHGIEQKNEGPLATHPNILGAPRQILLSAGALTIAVHTQILKETARTGIAPFSRDFQRNVQSEWTPYCQFPRARTHWFRFPAPDFLNETR